MLTRDRLAQELLIVAEKARTHSAAIYRRRGERGKTGEFDDYSDVHICGPTALHGILRAHGMTKFAARVAQGEFDATLEESEEWARKQTDPDTVALMERLDIGPDRSKDQ